MLDAVTFAVGNDTGLLVALIISAPEDAQLYMLCPSSSNTTVFDITGLPKSVGDCKDSLPSSHGVTGCNTTVLIFIFLEMK